MIKRIPVKQDTICFKELPENGILIKLIISKALPPIDNLEYDAFVAHDYVITHKEKRHKYIFRYIQRVIWTSISLGGCRVKYVLHRVPK